VMRKRLWPGSLARRSKLTGAVSAGAGTADATTRATAAAGGATRPLRVSSHVTRT
jgi:hypothetical protein